MNSGDNPAVPGLSALPGRDVGQEADVARAEETAGFFRRQCADPDEVFIHLGRRAGMRAFRK